MIYSYFRYYLVTKISFVKTIQFISVYSFLILVVVSCSTERREDMMVPLDLSSSAFTEKSRDNNFTTSLKGHHEVPAVPTKATGQVIVKISKDENFVYYKLIVSNLENVFAAHFHMGVEGENGSVVAFLFAGNVAEQNGILAEGIITAEDLIGPLEGRSLEEFIKQIEVGGIYVNVHTTKYPSGAIRGQL